jgi:hypothetical protein
MEHSATNTTLKQFSDEAEKGGEGGTKSGIMQVQNVVAVHIGIFVY